MFILLFHDELINNFKFSGDFTDFMDKIVVIIRNPLKSAISEFNRMAKTQVKSFSDIHSFMRRALKTKKIDNETKILRSSFKHHFQSQLHHLWTLVAKYTKLRKPVLFISYEDMQENLLPQLLRIAMFMNLGENENILERSVCTVLAEDRIRRSTKRKYNVDFTETASSLVNGTHTAKILGIIDRLFKSSGRHEMRTEEYISLVRHNSKL